MPFLALDNFLARGGPKIWRMISLNKVVFVDQQKRLLPENPRKAVSRHFEGGHACSALLQYLLMQRIL